MIENLATVSHAAVVLWPRVELLVGSSTWLRPSNIFEIKAEDLPPFGKTTQKILCSENIVIFYLLVTQKEPIFSVLTPRNSTEIMKLVPGLLEVI